MKELLEIDRFLELSSTGIVIHKDKAAIRQRIEDYFDNEIGSFWGKPWKGHDLKKFHFRKVTRTMQTILELELYEALPLQIPEIVVFFVSIEKLTSGAYKYMATVRYLITASGLIDEVTKQIIDDRAK
jgi:hypothetical protein